MLGCHWPESCAGLCFSLDRVWGSVGSSEGRDGGVGSVELEKEVQRLNIASLRGSIALTRV